MGTILKTDQKDTTTINFYEHNNVDSKAKCNREMYIHIAVLNSNKMCFSHLKCMHVNKNMGYRVYNLYI